MINIKENEQLAPYTTFKIGGPAKFFCAAKNVDELKEALKFAADNNQKILILGGGSNMLISDNGFDGLVIKIEFSGRKVVKEDKGTVWLEVAAGENWDNVVEFANTHGWWGIENLSHIPGSCGAIAVQNVGAYGQEASQVLEKVSVLDTSDGQQKTFKAADCHFGYRSSIFNTRDKGRYVILSVVMKLDKTAAPELSYRDLQNYFAGKVPTLSDIRYFITATRDKKFPFPGEAKNGNAGSFFKNVSVDPATYSIIKTRISESVGPGAAEALDIKKFDSGGVLKIPTAFLLDICGLKALSLENVRVNAAQPLVLVNFTGKAKAAEVLQLAGQILKTVRDRTGIMLQIEPELTGFSQDELVRCGII